MDMNAKMFVQLTKGRMGYMHSARLMSNLRKAREIFVDNIRFATIVISIKEPRLPYPRFNQVGFCSYRVRNNLHSKKNAKERPGIALFKVCY